MREAERRKIFVGQRKIAEKRDAAALPAAPAAAAGAHGEDRQAVAAVCHHGLLVSVAEPGSDTGGVLIPRVLLRVELFGVTADFCDPDYSMLPCQWYHLNMGS